MYRQQQQIEELELFAFHGIGKSLHPNPDLYGSGWGDPSESTQLQPVMQWLLQVLEHKHNPSVLEIGCGGGRWTEQIQRILNGRGELHVVDGTPAAFDLTQAHLKRCGLPTAKTTEVCLEGKLIRWTAHDVIFSFDVFVHFDDDLAVRYFESIADMLKPGGRALVSIACEFPTEDTATETGWVRSDEWFNYLAAFKELSHGNCVWIREPLESLLLRHFELIHSIPLIQGYGQLFIDLKRK